MCFRLVLSTTLLILVAIILISSSSAHRRIRKYGRYGCGSLSLPKNAEWIKTSYGKKFKGLFKCCEGYEMKVKAVCYYGKWRVKIVCIEKPTTTAVTSVATEYTMATETTLGTEPTTIETTLETETPSTEATPSTTIETTLETETPSTETTTTETTPTTETTTTEAIPTTTTETTTTETTPTTTTETTTTETTPTTTTETTTTETTPTTTTETTTTASTTSTTTTEAVIKCDSDPMVENGVITSETISTEVGSVVQYNCTAGFTQNGRLGTLTCNAEGEFVPSLVCDDCRRQDMLVSTTNPNQQVSASSETECYDLCVDDPDCVSSQFIEPNICIFDITITSSNVQAGSEEACRQSCYINSRCEAFVAPTLASQAIPALCTLFTRKPDAIAGDMVNLLSTCV